jgi:hypothetical protein
MTWNRRRKAAVLFGAETPSAHSLQAPADVQWEIAEIELH